MKEGNTGLRKCRKSIGKDNLGKMAMGSSIGVKIEGTVKILGTR
jgi:hypothetical protein